jgi:hypothetical protein
MTWYNDNAISKFPQFGFRPNSATHDAVFALKGIIHAHKVYTSLSKIDSFLLLRFFLSLISFYFEFRRASWIPIGVTSQTVGHLSHFSTKLTPTITLGSGKEALFRRVPGSQKSVSKHQP